MSRKQKLQAYKLGHFAEDFAVMMLRLKGYSIAERRYKTKIGEIDIIARKGVMTIFCEVKARKNYITAIESLSHKQKSRISKAAEIYMGNLKSNRNNNKIENNIYRCDMILVIPWRWPVHIENAW